MTGGFYHLMITLAVFDLLYVLLSIVLFGVPAILERYSRGSQGGIIEGKNSLYVLSVKFIQ